MRKIPTILTNELNVKNIKGYFERKVTKFGTGAKIDAPKEYLGKKVIILVCDDGNAGDNPKAGQENKKDEK